MLIRFIVASALAPPESAAAEPSPAAKAGVPPTAPVSPADVHASEDGRGALPALSLVFFFLEGGGGGAAAAAAAAIEALAVAVAVSSSATSVGGGAALPQCAASIVGCDGRSCRRSRHAQQHRLSSNTLFENNLASREYDA